ncbi:hypothetical protein FXB40_19125 [Bradyrhizobium rifense]|uniref:Uncharacterized protein n=1 Tax=Bradyrhizobium rifense TaxID=515499 RepID=A0A5D3KCD5_9BRAD|nr:hypothetical protein FXB40_19125 [Bradyrhizobium rifense]
MHKPPGLVFLVAATCSFQPVGAGATGDSNAFASETPRSMLAAQIRMQGFTCDKPLGALRDTKRSRPDRAVWVLKCSNATYRITRAPDMAAKVEPLP